MHLPTVAQSISSRLLFRVRILGRALAPAGLRLRLRRLAFYRKLVDRLPWEADVIAVLKTIVEPGWTAIDLGGHVGRFTTDLADMVGSRGHVVVFEPHPDNVRLIKERIARNDLENRVEVVQAAVSDGVATSVRLYEGREKSSAEWNIVGMDVHGHARTPQLEVPSIALDAFMDANRHVNFVKMDIEGAEHLALRGMARILTRERPVLFVEFHQQTDYRQCCEILQAAGYRLFKLDGTPAEPYPAPPTYHTLAMPTAAPF
jgi:FkbM family methyltransferase